MSGNMLQPATLFFQVFDLILQVELLSVFLLLIFGNIPVLIMMCLIHNLRPMHCVVIFYYIPIQNKWIALELKFNDTLKWKKSVKPRGV